MRRFLWKQRKIFLIRLHSSTFVCTCLVTRLHSSTFVYTRLHSSSDLSVFLEYIKKLVEERRLIHKT